MAFLFTFLSTLPQAALIRILECHHDCLRALPKPQFQESPLELGMYCL